MTNHYTDLAHAKDELRRAKDHEQTIRAIAEYVELSGKTVDDRKRELAFYLYQNEIYTRALKQLRDAEEAVDQAQAAIDQAEQERREKEWSIRARLVEALNRQHIESEDAVPDWLADRRAYDAGREQYNHTHVIKAEREMDEADPDPDADYQADMQAERYSSGFDATRRRMVAQREMDDLYPTK